MRVRAAEPHDRERAAKPDVAAAERAASSPEAARTRSSPACSPEHKSVILEPCASADDEEEEVLVKSEDRSSSAEQCEAVCADGPQCEATCAETRRREESEDEAEYAAGACCKARLSDMAQSAVDAADGLRFAARTAAGDDQRPNDSIRYLYKYTFCVF